jgi:hypothetical protein
VYTITSRLSNLYVPFVAFSSPQILKFKLQHSHFLKIQIMIQNVLQNGVNRATL